MHEFRLPGVIHFGWGAFDRLGDEASRLGERALLVTGRSAMKKTGVLGRAQSLLAEAGLAALLFDEVESDPSGSTIDRGGKLAREESCDLVVGLGGGSPMDAARGIAAMAVLEGSIIDYLRGKAVDRPGLPLVNVATTAGTASEITSVSVVLDEERELKAGVRSPFWFARAAITDPELTTMMPPALTAATGLDALTHAAESYLSTRATPPTEALALRAIALIGSNLRAAVADGDDRGAREAMALASMTAGMAFANSGLGLVHALAHPVGVRYGVAHGVACGRLLPQVLKYNAAAVPERVAAVGGVLLGRQVERPEDTVEGVESLVADVGVTIGIADLPIDEQEMPGLAQDTLASGSVRVNPRPVTEEDARAVLDDARRAG
jgi:1,3-propanediol dehydrogenase/alcohol dehydrogenase